MRDFLSFVPNSTFSVFNLPFQLNETQKLVSMIVWKSKGRDFMGKIITMFPEKSSAIYYDGKIKCIF